MRTYKKFSVLGDGYNPILDFLEGFCWMFTRARTIGVT